jgi:hypothetical protein
MVDALRTQRRVGATVIVLLSLLVVGLQFARGHRQRDRQMTAAFEQLAQADAATPAMRADFWREAQRQFGRSAAIVSLEPQAMLGVALTESWLDAPQPLPVCLPAAATQQGATEQELITIVGNCLRARQPEQVLAWGQLAGVTRHGGDLAQSIAFAAAWQQARDGQKFAKLPKN